MVINSETTIASGKAEIAAPEMDADKVVSCILVVDDSAAERMRIAMMLNKHGHKVVQACDGKDALDKLKQHSVALIVTDWSMPQMDGLTLCQIVKTSMAVPPHVMVLTGRTSKCELVAAMENGADDYLCKPFNCEELRVRVLAALRLHKMRQVLTQQNNELEQALARETQPNAIMLQHLSAAAKLQRAALPARDSTVNHIAVAHYFKPAQEVAGESYAILPLGDSHTAFFHLDVSGHGMRAAMLSYAISRYIDEQVRRHTSDSAEVNMLSPKQVLSALNTEFTCNEECRDYFTLVYGVIENHSGAARLSQAGHPYPFLVSPEGAVTRLGSGGVPIGQSDNAEFEESTFILAPRTRLVLYSDGWWECKIADDINFNENMLAQVVGAMSKVPLSKLQIQLDLILNRLIGSAIPKDDVSFFLLERDQHQEH